MLLKMIKVFGMKSKDQDSTENTSAKDWKVTSNWLLLKGLTIRREKKHKPKNQFKVLIAKM